MILYDSINDFGFFTVFVSIFNLFMILVVLFEWNGDGHSSEWVIMLYVEESRRSWVFIELVVVLRFPFQLEEGIVDGWT